MSIDDTVVDFQANFSQGDITERSPLKLDDISSYMQVNDETIPYMKQQSKSSVSTIGDELTNHTQSVHVMSIRQSTANKRYFVLPPNTLNSDPTSAQSSTANVHIEINELELYRKLPKELTPKKNKPNLFEDNLEINCVFPDDDATHCLELHVAQNGYEQPVLEENQRAQHLGKSYMMDGSLGPIDEESIEFSINEEFSSAVK